MRTLAACLLLLTACDDGAGPSGAADAGLADMALLDGSAGPDAAGPDAAGLDAAPPDAAIEPNAGLVAAPADAPGPIQVARARFAVTSGTRSLTVELWYPAEGADHAPLPVTEVYPEGADRDAYRTLIQTRQHCATTTASTPLDAPITRTRLPLILMSHCHVCTRFNMFSVARYLASHGFVVAAPDHVGNTLFDELRGEAAAVGGEFLQVRGADMRDVLDALLGGELDGVAGEVAARVDPERVGILGHSFGAVTAGYALERDDRLKAGIAVAAPVENPLVPGVTLANITQPTLHVVAVEDNSITELGNTFIRNNFGAIATPTHKIEVADAGHWSFSDLAGIIEAFEPGCRDGTRQTNDEPFTYLQPEQAIPILAAYATAFFRAYLADDAAARALLTGDPLAPQVTVETRE